MTKPNYDKPVTIEEAIETVREISERVWNEVTSEPDLTGDAVDINARFQEMMMELMVGSAYAVIDGDKLKSLNVAMIVGISEDTRFKDYLTDRFSTLLHCYKDKIVAIKSSIVAGTVITFNVNGKHVKFAIDMFAGHISQLIYLGDSETISQVELNINAELGIQ